MVQNDLWECYLKRTHPGQIITTAVQRSDHHLLVNYPNWAQETNITWHHIRKFIFQHGSKKNDEWTFGPCELLSTKWWRFFFVSLEKTIFSICQRRSLSPGVGELAGLMETLRKFTPLRQTKLRRWILKRKPCRIHQFYVSVESKTAKGERISPSIRHDMRYVLKSRSYPRLVPNKCIVTLTDCWNLKFLQLNA